MKRSRSIHLAVSCLLALLCSATAAQETDPLAQVEQLSRVAVRDAQTVSRLTGVALAADAGASTRYFRVFRGQSARGPIRGVELRAPVDEGAATGTLVALTLPPDGCVPRGAVTRRFDGERRVSMPRPGSPGLVFDVFRREEVELRFGFTRDGTACLRRVVIDAIPPG